MSFLDGPGKQMYPKTPLGEREPGIPTGRDVEWQPLVDYRRHGVSETTIHGAVSWTHGDEVIHSFGGNVLCYGRSMMKPFTRVYPRSGTAGLKMCCLVVISKTRLCGSAAP